MSVMMQEAPVAKATTPDYCAQLRAETIRIRQAYVAINHDYITRLNGTARRVAEAVIVAYAFPTVYGPHYKGMTPILISLQQAEFMIDKQDRSRTNDCTCGIGNARYALREARQTRQ